MFVRHGLALTGIGCPKPAELALHAKSSLNFSNGSVSDYPTSIAGVVDT